MRYQTNVQNSGAIKFGSGVFEISENGTTWVNLGAMRDIVFEEQEERLEVPSDNAGPVLVGVRNQLAILSGNLMEIDLEKLKTVRKGKDVYSYTAGTLVSGATQDFASGSWSFNGPLVIEHQNADKSQLTINSISGSTDGALIEDTDYFVGKNQAGDTVVIIIDSATVTTEDQTITVNYDYTPYAKKTLKSGGKTEITAIMARVTNFDEEDKMFRITLNKAESSAGIVINFQPDEGEDPDMIPIQLTGRRDTARTIGEQVFTIEDEQGVA